MEREFVGKNKSRRELVAVAFRELYFIFLEPF